jgi:hypothetical protein
MNQLTIGSKVIRIAATTDYTNGRKGEIVEIDEAAGRYRVRWTLEANGRPVNSKNPEAGTRTWVKYQFVRAA